MRNIQMRDGAFNATLSVFQATEEEFRQVFPGPGQDLEIVEEYVERVGEAAAGATLGRMWMRPIAKRDVQGLHGTLLYDYLEHAHLLPASRREMDRDASQRNQAERDLFQRLRSENME